ncbi:hypothetical protein GS597_08565 [Synechococcales cyanobacterium C]|uniref:DUF2281 domain-containing protein n=1 Tax=Petrachloros mirabilis ULC683 TaxID=2781853 RepID=A0A8K1ZX84_9CYAN|nr:hypothetical protein [Petrachloros mirabilis]NCJ06558.1 hypothetical protein [Petrachloros mirabilis ULC683]
MVIREALKQKLDTFTDDQLRQIADFIEFLEFRIQKTNTLNSLDDTPKEQVLSDFRQAWHEAMTDQGMPVAQLWEELRNE